MRWPGAIGSSYRSQSPIADNEEVFNFILERMESQGAASEAVYYPIPGVTLLLDASEASNVTTTTSSGPGRGSFTLTYQGDEYQFLVIGDQVYMYDGTAILQNIGAVAVDSNPATICWNGDGGGQVFITSGDNGYIYDLASTAFSTVRTGATTFGGYLDGYFVALDSNNSTFYISDLLDGTTWDPTQFAQRSIGADPWVGMGINNRYIYLLGTLTGEVWYNAGTYPFPFAFYPSGYLNYGTSAPFSIASADGAINWLGASDQGNGFVCRATGFNPEIISTFALQYQISRYIRVSDAIGDTYNKSGHTFYLLTFPSANVTLAYDVSTGDWAKRGTWNSLTTEYFAWRPLFHSFAFGRNTMLDRSGTGFYELSENSYYDVEDIPIRRMRRLPTLIRENKHVFVNSIEALFQPGVGTSGQGEDPQVSLKLSKNGGRTWGPEQFRSVGKTGEYENRTRWNRCGMGRKFTAEIAMSDPVFYALVDVFVSIKGEEEAGG